MSLTQTRLKEVIKYNPDTGEFTWNIGTGCRKVGDHAGCYIANGQLQIDIDKKSYLAHRLAWLYVYGVEAPKRINRLDKDPKNNRISNLVAVEKGVPGELTLERLKELLTYTPETGIFTWNLRTSNRVSVGDIAGQYDEDGYVQIRIDGKMYRAHRLAWLYVKGAWPSKHIDHKDGVVDNNRIENLRDVSRCGNLQNQRKPKKGNRVGFLGVSASTSPPWGFRARIFLNGKERSLGHFSTPEEAHKAYLTAKRELHSTCTI